MARFFLDLHECGEVVVDQDGVDAEHFAGAKALAVTAARDIMCGEVAGGSLCLSCFIEIRNEQQEVLDRIMFRDTIQISGL